MSKTIVFPKSERSCSASSVGVTVGTLIAEIEAAMLRADGVLILDVVDGIDEFIQTPNAASVSLGSYIYCNRCHLRSQVSLHSEGSLRRGRLRLRIFPRPPGDAPRRAHSNRDSATSSIMGWWVRCTTTLLRPIHARARPGRVVCLWRSCVYVGWTLARLAPPSE